MTRSIGICGFCGRPLDGCGSRTCDCAASKSVVSTLLVTVARAARLAAALRPLSTATDVTHYRSALRITRSIERKAA